MCEFKALHADRQRDGQLTSSQTKDTVCLEEFYTFFEVQNLKWTKVRGGKRDGILSMKNKERRKMKGKTLDMKQVKNKRINGNLYPMFR